MNLIISLLKSIRVFLISFLLFVLSYSVLAFFGSSISTTTAKEKGDVGIYILSNGVHTDIVVPTSNKFMDWTTYFPTENTIQKGNNFNFLALGWGSKGFYLETPTWGDLTFRTAFNALFGLSESAIHATYYRSIQPNNTNCFKIMLSENQYNKLCAYIINSLKLKNNNSQHIQTDANYGTTDAFYEAGGSYNLFYTCNTWSNNALKTCEQRAALWTPFDKGIIQHYKK